MKVYIAAYSTPFGGEAARQAEKEIQKENMKIYLAGAHSRSHKDWPQMLNKNMKVYLSMGADGNSACYKEHDVISGEYLNKSESKMKLYLGGTHSENNRANSKEDFKQKIYVLESFYYIKDWMIPYIKTHWHFILDSGAFTFMNNKKNTNGINWDKYLEKYAAFIVKCDIDLFFELDIDVIVGIKEVERLRAKLERLTDKQCIPVWHKSRGKDYWLQMAKDYDYVAIGGIVTREIKPVQYPFFTWLLNEAKKENCKVHGLGFTNLKGMSKYKFYSVDSTAWIYGNRGGFLYHFNGKSMDKIQSEKPQRLKSRNAAIHNFKEWVKFQKYADKNL